MEEQFGNKLMYLRKGKGLSQEELGNLVNVSRQTVSKWELNQTTPEMEKLISLGDIFNITIDELVGREAVIRQNPSYDELNEKMDTIIRKGQPYHYEYKSGRTLGGLPLVHVNIGRGMYRAKGVISIGMVSTGIISLGVFSVGVISIGVVALGIFALAALAVGLMAGGSISLGILAVGAISIGYVSFGALAIGYYSIGADAIAHRIALGDTAYGHLAIGKTSVKGTVEFLTGNNSKEEIKAAILKEYPNMWKWLQNLFISILNRMY